MECTTCMPRKPWELAFLAEPEEVAHLRRILRAHLRTWGLTEVMDAAQLCVSELVTNVIKHVGAGTPTILALSMNGTLLRVEVQDPDTRALPVLVSAASDAGSGRGLALVDAVAERWGVGLVPDRKITWCELATGAMGSNGHSVDSHVARAARMLGCYADGWPLCSAGRSRSHASLTEGLVIDAISDLLHWMRVHGYDADDALDRAQTGFELQSEALNWP